ncbi:hypothetical protein EJ08DRAFT_674523 [Tothia fuscella]|uniref:DUF7580 domain-containing protein n=1 Tax=Tothia fuscella TaxID=1048955 RepID=A0A9P4U525_9PEZI|nr:hypothetical protein EJ08DRAFT_674523 [Tothia fuscella]
MATGIEVAGLALAILPLVVEAAKAYSSGVNTILNVTLNSRRDAKLQDFYDDFWWETDLLHRHLKGLVTDLPLLCPDCKAALESDETLTAWEQDQAVRDALSMYFGSQNELDSFTLIVGRILGLIDKLVQGKVNYLTTKEKMNTNMYTKLKDFVSDRKSGKTSSTFFERFRFFKEEKNRNACVKNLKTWNKRLSVLMKSQSKQRSQALAIESKPGPSFSEIRKLFNSLLTTIGEHWDCNCPSRHEAMVCLKAWPSAIRNGQPKELEFELLFPGKPISGSERRWLESTVLVSQTKGAFNDRVLLPKLCDVFVDTGDSSLRFLVEVNSKKALWRLRSQPKKLLFPATSPRMSLQESLSGQLLKTLKVKRVLALTFAYALIQCMGSTCSRRTLEKDSVFFYHLTVDTVDFERPYLSTRFDAVNQAHDAADMSIQHRNPRILELGILLLEIHKGRPLSTFRLSTEISNPSPNTDLSVARRVVETLEDWCSEPYKDAVRACLELPWVPAGKKADLDDEAVGSGFYDKVIKPLEGELEYLFRLKI